MTTEMTKDNEIIGEEPTMPTLGEIEGRFMTVFGYNKAAANCLAGKVCLLKTPLKEVFIKWWQTGEIDHGIVIEGIVLGDLLTKQKLKVPSALTSLQDLANNPGNSWLRTQLSKTSPPPPSDFRVSIDDINEMRKRRGLNVLPLTGKGTG